MKRNVPFRKGMLLVLLLFFLLLIWMTYWFAPRSSQTCITKVTTVPVHDPYILSPSKERPGCTGAYELGGEFCHHFLYGKGHALWTRDELIHKTRYLPEFLEHYQTSDPAFHVNEGGQRLSHLFAVWSIARALRPAFVIESGKYRGWGLYNVRRALGPNAVLYSIDPVDRKNTYVDENANTHYFGGTPPLHTMAHFSEFRDIAEVEWSALGVVPEDTLIVLDDHMSVPRRVAEMRKQGFRHFYIDDNAPRPAGDSLCPKYLSDPRPPLEEQEWRIPLYDHFGILQEKATYTELLRQGQTFFDQVRVYHEFPPIVLHPAFYQERAKDFHTSSAQEIWEMTAEPLLAYEDSRLKEVDLNYGAVNYYYCAYLEVY